MKLFCYIEINEIEITHDRVCSCIKSIENYGSDGPKHLNGIYSQFNHSSSTVGFSRGDVRDVIQDLEPTSSYINVQSFREIVDSDFTEEHRIQHFQMTNSIFDELCNDVRQLEPAVH